MKLGLTVGAAVLAALTIAACVNEEDEFNAEAAERICAYNGNDPERPFLDRTREIETDPDPFNPQQPLDGIGEPGAFAPYGGPDCEGDVERNLNACNARCTFNARKARRCLRVLNRSLRRGEYPERTFAVCERVYRCPDDVLEPECRITTSNGCTTDPGSAPTALMVLALIGLFRRRRD